MFESLSLTSFTFKSLSFDKFRMHIEGLQRTLWRYEKSHAYLKHLANSSICNLSSNKDTQRTVQTAPVTATSSGSCIVAQSVGFLASSDPETQRFYFSL